jgi:hypothetical protein
MSRLAGEAAERVMSGGARGCGVGDDGQAGVGGYLQGLVIEVQVPGDRVMEGLDAAAVVPDVVGGPVATELLAAGGQVADELAEGAPGALRTRRRP